MQKPAYRPSRIRSAINLAFRASILGSFIFAVGTTVYVVTELGRYYIFDKPVAKKQKREYAEAILFKSKREKELGLVD
ncbi:unnamed protein product [Protopolystoma xenopodis]|uniref:Uncharacterized protein n=1 Tax=Protopolystoma xenopodis TaxID=117903 RepID=A0A448XA78_9PLAT|nr:unnamed protein product [Protopolystoma xenopodis]